MPTRKAMEIARAAGDVDAAFQDEGAVRHPCYVCGEALSGLSQRDTPTPEASRKMVVLGDRHRKCEPSADAGESRKVYLGVG